MSVAFWCFALFVCLFLYGPSCHGALKVVIHVEIPKAAPKSPFVIFKIRDDIEMK